MSATDLNWQDVFEETKDAELESQVASVAHFDYIDTLQNVFVVLWIIFALLSLILFAVLQWVKFKIKKQREKEAAFFASQERSEIAMRLYGTDPGSSISEHEARREDLDPVQRWCRIQKLYHSGKKSDKKLAVLEADILLKDLLLSLGFKNDTLGKMLKMIEKEQFNMLEEAWDAHKIRNELAHSSLPELDLSSVARAMRLYEKIFRHFDFI